jgi:class 3 adenylate cyclase
MIVVTRDLNWRRLNERRSRVSWFNPILDLRGDHADDKAALEADIVQFSLMSRLRRDHAMRRIDAINHRVCRRHDAMFYDVVGDGMSAVFDNANSAIAAGLNLVSEMDAEGFQLRAAVACGPLVRRFKWSKWCFDFDGDARIEAARVLPTALPGELLAALSLMNKRQIDTNRYQFSLTSREWPKSGAGRTKGECVYLFSVTSRA